MALVKLGGGVTDIRGSIGGNTFSRCAGGNYMRARTKPVNPRAPTQNARRSTVAYLTKRWSNALTEQQRTDWRAYAASTTWTNKLGESIAINGLAAYLRLNAVLLLSLAAPVDDAPTAVGHAGGNTLTFTAESDTGKLQIAEPVGSFDKDLDGHYLFIFSGFPTEAGRIATPKGFKYIDVIEGDSVTAPTFPVELTAPYTMAEGQFITARAMFVDEANRASGPFWATATAAPSV